MQFIIYDFEVYNKDWIVVFKKEGDRTIIINDCSLLQSYYDANKDNIFVGFNNKHYDDYIFKAILSGIDPKRVSDYIIVKGKQGWEFPGLGYFALNSLDVKQDISSNLSLSLKEAEGNMGETIEETTVPFDITRKLTEKELQEVISYCCIDVDNTEKILLHRKNDIEVRLEILQMFDLPITHIGKTNAKLAAVVLDARKRDRNDEFIYDFPDNLQLKNKEIYNLYNQTINYNNTLTTDICGVSHILGYGGLHGAKAGYFEGNIWYADVKSYYPTLMLKYNYISRNISSFTKYNDIYNLRFKYKREGNKKERGLKLLLNTTYGAMKNRYNPLYDPKQANQVCISGQLFLIDLLEKLEPYIDLIQSNTDGLMFISYNDEKVKEVITEWEIRTGFNVGIDMIEKIWQKDVNNYIKKNVAPDKNGNYTEVKGGYVKFYNGGTYANNTTSIIDKAVVDYFINNTPVAQTINDCNDLMAFQYICKKGPTYIRVEQDGKILNNCNRVFASKDLSKGNLYKVKENGRKDSIAGLPPHCDVVNENLANTQYNINSIDKQWYINIANNRINEFIKKE